ncbi:hypothetical protein ACFL1H_01830 [Nanoarchaeota archaeon]
MALNKIVNENYEITADEKSVNTNYGLVGTIFAVGTSAATYMFISANNIAAKEGVGSIFTNDAWFSTWGNEVNAGYCLMNIMLGTVLALPTLYCGISDLIGNYISSNNKVSIDVNKKNIKESRSSLSGRKDYDFDYVTSIEVKQNSLDKIINRGRIIINTLKINDDGIGKNKKLINKKIIIPHQLNPSSVQDELKESLLDYTFNI